MATPRSFAKEHTIEVLELVGKGATGHVYRANVDGQVRALKQISLTRLDRKKQRKLRMDIKTELELLRALSHRSIIRYDGMYFSPDMR